MEIYTLVGKSGTGKSFHAMELCQRYHIEAIIDDGLFIYENTVAAGVSAKREATKIGAVKVALFQDDEIRDQVAGAIKKKNPSSILVLGTSVGMTDKIILRLGLLGDVDMQEEVCRSADTLQNVEAPEGASAGCGEAGGAETADTDGNSDDGAKQSVDAKKDAGVKKDADGKIDGDLKIRRNGANLKALEKVHRIFIEDITTEEERQAARTQRDKLGKHVIPAPALQLKRNFAGYFMDPLRLFRGKDTGAAAERTVVRPTYSYMGEYFVDERVLEDIVTCIAYNMPSVGSVIRVSQDPRPEAFRLSVAVKLNRGFPVWETAETLQNLINEKVELMTAFNVTEVDVELRDME